MQVNIASTGFSLLSRSCKGPATLCRACYVASVGLQVSVSLKGAEKEKIGIIIVKNSSLAFFSKKYFAR